MDSTGAELPELVIEAGRAERQYWRDLWRYRELFYFLAWRDLLVRYKQTAIGIAWAVMRPLLTMIVFTLIFSKMAGLTSKYPYALLVFAGLLPWQFFATSLAEASSSLTGNANLISKVYFPRLIVPASTLITSLVDLLISFGLLFALFVWYRFVPGWQFLTLPIWVGWALLASLGPSLYVTAMNVKYRDFRFVVPFAIQFGLFFSPVAFSSADLTRRLHLPRMIYSLNPVVGVIDGFRWAIGGANEPLYWPGLAVSAAVTFALFALGVWYFRKTERTFADII